MNGLILNQTPKDNIYEERKRQISNIVTITKNILQSTGFEKFKWGNYESGDPTLQTLYRILKAEKIDPSDKKKIQIKVPVAEGSSFLINGNRYMPVFQISDVSIFKRSKYYIILHNTYCNIALNAEMNIIKFGKIECPLILFLIHTSFYDIFSGDELVEHSNHKDLNHSIYIRITNSFDLKLSREKYGNLLEPFTEELLQNIDAHQEQFDNLNEGLSNILKGWKVSTKVEKVIALAKVKDYVTVPNGIFEEAYTMVDLVVHVYKNRELYANWTIRDINDISKRRVRLSEWVCYKVAQQHRINSAKNSSSVYPDALVDVLNLDQRRILDDSVNPLGELCMQSRVIYNGPGGIAKESCSVMVRNLHETYKEIIDPIDTPTGEAVGICQHIVPDASLKSGVLKKSKSHSILSTASQLVPLLQHNDAIRVEMACNQMRQAISLKNPEVPLVKSGSENLYMEYTNSLKIAEAEGQVIFKDRNLMIVKYFNEEDGDVIELTPKSFTDFDKTLITELELGDKFKKGDTLAHTTSINRDTKEIMLGKNLLTGFMSLDSWNFEDAIVISESASKKMSSKCTYTGSIDLKEQVLFNLSEDEDVYIPVYENGTYVEEGDVIFRLGKLEIDSLESITPEIKEILAPVSGIFSYQIYLKTEQCNHARMLKWNKKKIEEQEVYEKTLKDNLGYLQDSQKYVEKFCYLHNRKKIHDTFGVIKYSIQGEKPLKLGCKLSNRHGNKGTISIIMPDEKMPKLPDGRHLDIVLNPLGVITRMNVGQLYELHLTWFMDRWLNKYKDLNNEDFKKEVLKFISIVDNTPNKGYTIKSEAFLENNSYILEDIRKNGLQIVQPPFHSCTPEQLEELRKYCNAEYETEIEYEGRKCECSVGWMYIMRLHHEPDHKIFGRSLGVYGKYGQPPSGADAHRLGEMEVWALLAYEAEDTLKEFLSVKSDNPEERKRLFNYLYNGYGENYIPKSLETVTSSLFKVYLKGCGLNVELE